MFFDEVFPYIGGAGVYQIVDLVFVFSIVLVSVDAIRMNFIGGDMEHWCQIPALANFTHDEQKDIAIPYDESSSTRSRTWLSDLFGIQSSEEGRELKYEQCYRFPLDFSTYNLTELKNWNRTIMTDDIPRNEWVKCDAGWTFDQSEYYSTIGSEVSVILIDINLRLAIL